MSRPSATAPSCGGVWWRTSRRSAANSSTPSKNGLREVSDRAAGIGGARRHRRRGEWRGPRGPRPPAPADPAAIGGGVIGPAPAFPAPQAGLKPLIVEARPALCTLTTPVAAGAFRLQFDDLEELMLVRESAELFLPFA